LKTFSYDCSNQHSTKAFDYVDLDVARERETTCQTLNDYLLGPGIDKLLVRIDLICTPSGWVKVKGPAVIVGRAVLGWTPPVPPEWNPPFKCPPKDCS
jgi:hypothetical protein